MSSKQTSNKFHRTARRVFNALFYLFSAFTLVCTIIWTVRFIMGLFNASDTSKDYTSYGILTMVGIYVVGKTYYVLATWIKRRLKANEGVLHEETQHGQDYSNAQWETAPGFNDGSQRVLPNKKRSIMPKSNRKVPTAPIVKAGNSRW